MIEKILLFGAVLFAGLVLLTRFPNNPISRVFLLWYGPVPRNGETKSSFMFRWAWYGCKWAVVLAVAIAVMMYVGSGIFGIREPNDSPTFWVFMFAFPLLFGTAALGALICVVNGMWRRSFGHDPLFNEEAGDFVDNT